MPKITRYTVIAYNDVNKMNSMLNSAISQGWQPFGSVSIATAQTASGPVVVYSQGLAVYDDGNGTEAPEIPEMRLQW